MAPPYVKLEPQYRKASSGMEVEEVMDGEGTTYFLHSVFYFTLLFVYVV